jgi:transcriptional regulator with XRE-family HTH domain
VAGGWPIRAASHDLGVVDDQRIGSAIRSVRLKRRWRQADLAAAADVSRSTVSRIERGHLDQLSLETLRTVARALDVRVDLVARWRAGDLDRLLNARHSKLHESVARMFRDDLPAWALRPETSFAIFAERGVIDILAWHAGRRALLVIELKTDIVDVNELVGTVDRKRRLAAQVAAEFGWEAQTVSVWVIVADGRTNRARIAVHNAMLRAAFPTDGRSMRSWLRDPAEAVAAMSTWHDDHGENAMADATPIRRVRRPRPKAVGVRSRTKRNDTMA